MAKLTKSMLRNLIIEALKEEQVDEAWGWGKSWADKGTKSPLTPDKGAARMGAIGAAAGKEGFADSAPDDDRDAILALWDKVKGLETSVKSLTQDTAPTVMSPSMGGDEVPRPHNVAATVKSRVAESRRRRRKRKR